MSRTKNSPDGLAFERLLQAQIALLGKDRQHLLRHYGEADRESFHKLIDCYVHMLQACLDRNEAGGMLRPPFVLIGSKVHILYFGERRLSTLTICYPDEADPASGKHSFLSEIGRQLLMRRERQYCAVKSGDTVKYGLIRKIEWP
ncbi:GreA/GreB family elongation factor [Paenibacillus thermoaerophilus]|uniref:GreA/GreB family elongation factor n=1 Tax=Paenibacillus thermoaerophilus TaxID=1215385 RepID=A0ABW2V779_9BACL|nr:GreA/GreB family elongation factor [Paenibacillus thermoaerophilus]TMV17695.1 GreA/GreB family elongation factor [Paenibacillus thermoaerophilus]